MCLPISGSGKVRPLVVKKEASKSDYKKDVSSSLKDKHLTNSEVNNLGKQLKGGRNIVMSRIRMLESGPELVEALNSGESIDLTGRQKGRLFGMLRNSVEELHSKGAREIDKGKVNAIINKALKEGNKLHPTDNTKALKAAWEWSFVNRKEDTHDVNMAAAEHYLYARFESSGSISGGVIMGAASTGYDIVKTGAFAVGAEGLISAGDGTPSKPTFHSTVKGLEGTVDGLADNVKGKVESVDNGIKSVLGEAERLIKGQYGL